MTHDEKLNKSSRLFKKNITSQQLQTTAGSTDLVYLDDSVTAEVVGLIGKSLPTCNGDLRLFKSSHLWSTVNGT